MASESAFDKLARTAKAANTRCETKKIGNEAEAEMLTFCSVMAKRHVRVAKNKGACASIGSESVLLAPLSMMVLRRPLNAL